MSNLTGKKNVLGKKMKTFSFAFEDGYEAMDWLEAKGKETRGGMSSYLIKLLLEDKQEKTGHTMWLNKNKLRLPKEEN